MKIINRIIEFLMEKRDAVTELRRKHFRRSGGRAFLSIGDRQYEIQDWSRGGVRFNGFGVPFVVGDNVKFKLVFKLPHNTIAVEHEGKIVRAAQNDRGIAAMFEPLSFDVRHKFDRVIDSFAAEEFTQSQAA